MAGDNTSDMSALTNLPNFMRFPAPIPKIGDDALEDLNDYTTSDIIVRVNDKQLYFLHWPYLERTEYFAPQRAFSEGTAKLIEVKYIVQKLVFPPNADSSLRSTCPCLSNRQK